MHFQKFMQLGETDFSCDNQTTVKMLMPGMSTASPSQVSSSPSLILSFCMHANPKSKCLGMLEGVVFISYPPWYLGLSCILVMDKANSVKMGGKVRRVTGRTPHK